MKVRLGTSAMAHKVLGNGLPVLNQRVKPNQIEREIFVKITPCTNCYKYDHVTSRCPQEKMLLSAFCRGRNHKQKDCKKETPKCLNCGEQHRTLAAICPVRKELIKEKKEYQSEIDLDRAHSKGKQLHKLNHRQLLMQAKQVRKCPHFSKAQTRKKWKEW